METHLRGNDADWTAHRETSGSRGNAGCNLDYGFLSNRRYVAVWSKELKLDSMARIGPR